MEDNNSNKSIKISLENLDEIHKELGSAFYKDEGEILSQYVSEGKRLFYVVLNSVSRLVQVVGVIAGFGFVAFGSVQFPILFLSGEFLLFITIALGLFWDQRILISSSISVDEEVERVKKVYADNHHRVYEEIFNEVLKQIEQNGFASIDKKKMEELQQGINNIPKELMEKKQKKEGWNPLEFMWVLFVLGSFMLLLSFMKF